MAAIVVALGPLVECVYSTSLVQTCHCSMAQCQVCTSDVLHTHSMRGTRAAVWAYLRACRLYFAAYGKRQMARQAARPAIHQACNKFTCSRYTLCYTHKMRRVIPHFYNDNKNDTNVKADICPAYDTLVSTGQAICTQSCCKQTHAHIKVEMLL